MKRFLTVVLAMSISLGAAGCGDAIDAGVQEIGSLLSKDVEGEVGSTYRTEWFDFTINTLELQDEYKGETAEDGYQYAVANVTTKNTWDGDEEIPMGTFDFYLYTDNQEEAIFPEYAWDDIMMPEEYFLQPEEEATYDAVFLVPAEASAAYFVYLEIDEYDSTGAEFKILKEF